MHAPGTGCRLKGRCWAGEWGEEGGKCEAHVTRFACLVVVELERGGGGDSLQAREECCRKGWCGQGEEGD